MVLTKRVVPELPWGKVSEHDLETWNQRVFGTIRIWLKSEQGLLVLGIETGDFELFSISDEPPDSVDLQYYKLNSLRNGVLLMPSLPDRAIVATYDCDLSVLPGESLEMKCKIPVRLSVIDGSTDRKITEYQITPLSKTLFGETDTGEILYSNPGSLKLFNDDPENDYLEAGCPVLIENQSSEVLAVKRLCIRVEHLCLYLLKNMMITDTSKYSYKSSLQGSQISIVQQASKKQLRQSETLSMICPARLPFNNSILRKSFDFFKSLGDF